MPSDSSKNETSLQGNYVRQRHAPFPDPVPTWLRKKPLWLVFREIEDQQYDNNHQHVHDHCDNDDHDHTNHQRNTIRRHLTLFDLISVGVGGTVGSGIFVLAGFIAKNYAGPATILSFAVAGLAAAASGVCYAELSGRIPSSGSTYIYCYVCMGEVAAVIAAACLTLEYGVSGAAVARSWGDKVVVWIRDQWGGGEQVEQYLQPYGINMMAGLVSTVSVALLMGGIHESKQVTNFFTITKIALVLFMTVGGFILFQTSNIHSQTVAFAPFGVAGILRGATSSFFGYLGYDEVCCIAGEALHPHRDLPRAVLWTLFIVTVLYILASLSLSGMLPYQEISETSGFPAAFDQRDAPWAANISAFGEVFTLPVVVLIALMAQPRLQLAMAQDGLLPHIFAQVDETGNLKWGTFISGSVMVIVATFVPFSYLDDLISVGILLAFSMTNSCLILLRCESPEGRPNLVAHHLVALNALCLGTGLLFSHAWDMTLGPVLSVFALIATVVVVISLSMQCPLGMKFGGSVVRPTDGDSSSPFGGQDGDFFRTPCVPFLPGAGILINWCLVSQLELSGLLFLLIYVGLTVGAYLSFCNNTISSSNARWKQASYEHLPEAEDDGGDHEWTMLQRELSMPPIQASSNDVTSRKTGNTGTLT